MFYALQVAHNGSPSAAAVHLNRARKRLSAAKSSLRVSSMTAHSLRCRSPEENEVAELVRVTSSRTIEEGNAEESSMVEQLKQNDTSLSIVNVDQVRSLDGMTFYLSSVVTSCSLETGSISPECSGANLPFEYCKFLGGARKDARSRVSEKCFGKE